MNQLSAVHISSQMSLKVILLKECRFDIHERGYNLVDD
jgi:hypothetical protein